MKKIKELGHKKGQAVMEYLITYGLALLVIVIVLTILVAVVLPSLRAQESCLFTQPGFSCNQKKHILVADEDQHIRVHFQLDNEQGRPIVLTGLLCTNEQPGNVEKSMVQPLDSEETLAAGKSYVPLAGIDCIDGEESNVILAPNSDFTGTIAITYRYYDDVGGEGVPERLAVAAVSGVVQSE